MLHENSSILQIVDDPKLSKSPNIPFAFITLYKPKRKNIFGGFFFFFFLKKSKHKKQLKSKYNLK